MSDSKAVGSIEKINLLNIIFVVKLGLWVIQNDEFRGNCLLCCLWCSDMFTGYKKVLFFSHMGDGKVGNPIENAILGIIFAVKLGLWVIQKMVNSGVAACIDVVCVQEFLLNIRKLSSPNVLATAK